MRFFNHTMFAHITDGFKRHKKIILVTIGTIITILILASGGVFAYTKLYEGKIYPNTFIGGLNIGGLTQEESTDVLQNTFSSMLNNGLITSLDGQEERIDLRVSGSTDPDLIYDLMDFDTDRAVAEAFQLGRENGGVVLAVLKIFTPSTIDTQFNVLDDQIASAIHEAYKEQENRGEPTDFNIAISRNDVKISATLGFDGTQVETIDAIEALKKDAKDFELGTLQLHIEKMNDLVTEEEAMALEDGVREILDAAPYVLVHTSDAKKEYSWKITNDNLADWLIPVRQKDRSISLELAGTEFDTFLSTLHNTIDVAPQNARFLIEDGRVVEFAGSLNGEKINEAETISGILLALGTKDAEITLVVNEAVPEITTGSVNNFGITEILGVGTSDFAGSPSNRVKNIQNGASKLNGLLIPPGGTVSLIEQLGPFTYENGYLPELVIKGDEIKPEMGGGLCQIGTTTFRAVMNAGLEVTERRSHSLVVSYYNDPSNNNPGTDATIYDPAPDFKFTNNYADYILLVTEVDVKNGQLYFTFWGTNDGRHGYYTPPQVLSWNGYGSTQYVETDSLAPGVQKCQSPHPGASTTFDYIVEYADGTKKERTFTSTYRSLPRICLVGKTNGASGGNTGGVGAPITDTTPAIEATDELNVTDVVN